MIKDILQVKKLSVTFKGQGKQKLQAVSDVSFSIAKRETLGLVGESGCGKSSIARAIMQLPAPTSGHVIFKGADQIEVDLTQLTKRQLRRFRPRFQMIFQDSVSSLNPRRRVIDTLTAPLKVIGITDREEGKRRAMDMLECVGIDPGSCNQMPFQFSGGQNQRIQIARALMSEPELLICDEPVSSLDVSIQAQIINLLEALRKIHGLSMLFISHDLAVIKNICDRIMVMYLGKLCEEAPSEKLYKTHYHPYTRALINAIPRPDPNFLPCKKHLVLGEKPSVAAPPSGCRFRTRCPNAETLCAQKEPDFREIEEGHKVACHFPLSKNS